MKTIFILGGYGYTGKFLAKHLLAHTDANIIIAGRNLSKAQTIVKELNNPRVSARQADATDRNRLTDVLQGVTLCLVAAPTTHHAENVIRACIDARVDYLDVQFAAQKLKVLYAAQDEIQKANLCFITEAGYHPGLLAVLIRFAATKLDTLTSAVTAGYLNMKDIPYSEAVDELMEGFLDIKLKSTKTVHGPNHLPGICVILILAATLENEPVIPCSLKSCAPSLKFSRP